MNKLELIHAIGNQAGLNKSKSKKALNAFLAVIADELAKGKQVRITSFGTFKVHKRGPRKGIIPTTKAVIDIPEKKVPKFMVSTELASKVE